MTVKNKFYDFDDITKQDAFITGTDYIIVMSEKYEALIENELERIRLMSHSSSTGDAVEEAVKNVLKSMISRSIC